MAGLAADAAAADLRHDDPRPNLPPVLVHGVHVLRQLRRLIHGEFTGAGQLLQETRITAIKAHRK